MLGLSLLLALGVGDGPLPRSHDLGDPTVVVCPDAPVTVREARRAVRWWRRRCIDVRRVVAGTCEVHTPGHVYVGQLDPWEPGWPWAAGVTWVQDGYAQTLIAPDQDRWVLVHELGHALAFGDDDHHHTGPGTPMAWSTEEMGRSDEGVDLCGR